MLRHAAAIAFVLLLSLAGCNGDEEKKATNRVRILVTTDEHSHLLATAPEKDEWPLPAATAPVTGTGSLKGGIARRATVVERERADGTPTVLLSNGDFSQGTLSAVAYTVANFDVVLMRKLGYDAIALGNHEFDLGPAKVVSAVDAAKKMGGAPPFLLTNAIFSTTSTADDSLAAIYGDVGSGKDVVKGVLVDKGGIKVGVVSAMGPSAAFDVQYQAAPVTFSSAATTLFGDAYIDAANTDIAARLQPVVDQLRTSGAKVVVLLFHGGLQSTGSNGDIDRVSAVGSVQIGLVKHLTGVDVIVGGHTHGLPPQVVTHVADADGRQVPVVQPAAYGNQVARFEFVVGSGRPSFDASRAAVLAVDDTLPPTGDQEIRYDLSTAVSSIEGSLLPATLTAVTGSPIGDDPLVAGDLYFFPIGETAFDVTGATLPRETNALNLDTDAMLAVSNALLATPATVALQNAGSIRGDLAAGKTGVLGFSDVFRMVSLGGDPIEGTPGFPIVHAYINLASLRAAFEQTLYLSMLNNDYYVSPAGLKVEWSPSLSRLPWDGSNLDPTTPGWVTKMATVAADGTETVFYDEANVAAGGWPLGPTSPVSRVQVVTPLLVAAFAGNVGVSLYANPSPLDTTEIDLATPTGFNAAVVQWPTTAHLKDHQALARYIRGLGEIPAAKYDLSAPVRVVCNGPLCP